MRPARRRIHHVTRVSRRSIRSFAPLRVRASPSPHSPHRPSCTDRPPRRRADSWNRPPASACVRRCRPRKSARFCPHAARSRSRRRIAPTGVRLTNEQRLRRRRLRAAGRLLVLEQHQQPRRQRHDADLPGPHAPEGRRRPHAFQLQQDAPARRQPRPALPGRPPAELEHRRGLVLQRHAAQHAVPERRAAPAALRRREPHASRPSSTSARQFGADKYLWQAHSSADDRVHSATLRQSSTYEMLGCVVYNEDTRQPLRGSPRRATSTSARSTSSGRWLVIKENVDGLNGEDNRIIDLQTGTEQVLTRSQRRRGPLRHGLRLPDRRGQLQPRCPAPSARGTCHSTCTAASRPRRPVRASSSTSSRRGRAASGTSPTATRRAGQSIDQQMACASNASREALPRVNEIVCFRLDGSLNTLVVAPNLTDLNAPAAAATTTGSCPRATSTSPASTSSGRRTPAPAVSTRSSCAFPKLLAARRRRRPSPAPAPPPAPTPTPAPGPAPRARHCRAGEAVQWTSLVNVTATADRLRKSGGCGGCPDAGGGVRRRRSPSGDGELALVAGDTETLRVIGLSSGNAGTARRKKSASGCGCRTDGWKSVRRAPTRRSGRSRPATSCGSRCERAR